MIDPVSSAPLVDAVLPLRGGAPPAVEAAVDAPGATAPIRETDSATFSPEALEMLRASQDAEGG